MALTQPPAALSAVFSAGRGGPRRESAARAYACPLPVVPARTRGLTVEAADGRRYLDCFPGGGALVLGHHHPVVREAVRSALARGVPPAEVFADELRAVLPGRLADRARLRFCAPTREAALAVARALAGGAGALVETVGASGEGDADGSRGGDLAAVRTAAGAFGGAGGDGFSRARDLAAARTLTGRSGAGPDGDGGGEAPAGGGATARALLGPPGAGSGEEGAGDRPTRDAEAAWTLVGAQPGGGGRDGAPLRDPATARAEGLAGTVPGARDRTLLIADETCTGLGRTGVFWGVEHTGRVPDVMVLAGAIGGGLPLALLVHDVPAAHQERDAHGNRLAMAAGAATLRYVRENGLVPRAAALGARMLSRLRRAVADRDAVDAVHGRGLLLDVTCADAATAEAVRRACLRRGLLVGTDGTDPRLLRLLPPLTLTDDQAEAVLDRFTDAVGAVCGGPRAGGPVEAGGPAPARPGGRARPRASGAGGLVAVGDGERAVPEQAPASGAGSVAGDGSPVSGGGAEGTEGHSPSAATRTPPAPLPGEVPPPEARAAHWTRPGPRALPEDTTSVGTASPAAVLPEAPPPGAATPAAGPRVFRQGMASVDIESVGTASPAAVLPEAPPPGAATPAAGPRVFRQGMASVDIESVGTASPAAVLPEAPPPGAATPAAGPRVFRQGMASVDIESVGTASPAAVLPEAPPPGAATPAAGPRVFRQGMASVDIESVGTASPAAVLPEAPPPGAATPAAGPRVFRQGMASVDIESVGTASPAAVLPEAPPPGAATPAAGPRVFRQGMASVDIESVGTASPAAVLPEAPPPGAATPAAGPRVFRQDIVSVDIESVGTASPGAVLPEAPPPRAAGPAAGPRALRQDLASGTAVAPRPPVAPRQSVSPRKEAGEAPA
ncbi:aminotransferase class III-fold pyridoxal phosphate-dependent enzyme [Streptomyces huiliensis]|uniref:aminotransferase class III-fold pyridoxal phosphate-dependent enzyme n=1 Tax=Streptomyces huiliensis TaxID=2876027 RepID=UPI0027E1A098|nr:aminotransferase class III-fold pyridoxal phosphate-dependent enzyme [Streptomyces huiliensis]